jgi:hypothetical protein
MIAETIPGLRSLSADQKIILAAELWREAVGEGGADPDAELIEALQERLNYHRAHPQEVSGWEAVRSRIVGRKNS